MLDQAPMRTLCVREEPIPEPTTQSIKERNMYRNELGQRSFRLAAGVALLIAATLTTIPAIAVAEAPTSRTVKVSDLNLASPQGQQTLARRLRVAVNHVCAPSVGENRLRVSRSKVEECRKTAWADAQRQLQRHGLPTRFAASR